MTRFLARFALACALLVGLSLRGADERAISQKRRDIIRKMLEFHRVEVPTANGRVAFGLTVIETFGDDPLWTGAGQRLELRHRLIRRAIEWFVPRLAGNRAALRDGFADFLKQDPTIEKSRNTWLILSDANDFTNIQAMFRIAKGSRLPIESQFAGTLAPVLRPKYQRVPNNEVRIFSFRHEDPHFIVMQNAPVYTGDVVELKHYAAVGRHDVDLTALLFHLGQDLGLFAVSRYVTDGRELGLPPGPAIITPAKFVVGSDTPGLLRLLKDACSFSSHQVLGEAARPGAVTEVLIGTPEDLGNGLRKWHGARSNSWQLNELVSEPAMDSEFLGSFLSDVAGKNCRGLLRTLGSFDRDANRQLAEEVRRFGRPLR